MQFVGFAHSRTCARDRRGSIMFPQGFLSLALELLNVFDKARHVAHILF